LLVAATKGGDDTKTKNVDDGRSSRAAEDVGHSSTKSGVEGRCNKAVEDDDDVWEEVPRHKCESKTRAEPKGAATRLRKTTGKPERE
jgi:hypothetical protein